MIFPCLAECFRKLALAEAGQEEEEEATSMMDE